MCREVLLGIETEVSAKLYKLDHAGMLADVVNHDTAPHIRTEKTRKMRANRTVPRRKTVEELGDFGWRYRDAGVWPDKEPTISAWQIPDAFRQGQVSVMDASELFPVEWQNMTLQQLADMHPEAPMRCGTYGSTWCEYSEQARQCHRRWTRAVWLIAVFKFHPVAMWLLKNVLGPFFVSRCPEPATMKDMAERIHLFDAPGSSTPQWSPTDRPVRKHHDDLSMMERLRTGISATNLNIRRLPKLRQGWDSIERANLTGHARFTHGMLWFGNTPGGWHTDMQDNVLTQLQGEVDVMVVSPEASLACGAPTDHYQPLLEYMAQCKQRGFDARGYHIRLKPGLAAVVPSSAYHKVIVNSSLRVGLNTFFEPEFLGMQWAGEAPFNSFRSYSEDFLAMRILWLSVVRRLWDERGIALFFHTDKMEVL